jgi:ABC-type lipoprotein release transport system permease subunit
MNQNGQRAFFRGISLALLLILTFTQFTPPHASAARSTLTGTIIDESTGEPITKATVTVLNRRYTRYLSSSWSTHSSTTTDNVGRYTLNLETDGNYLILVNHLTEDEEHDYVPYGFYHNPVTEQVEKNMELWRASVIHFEGLAYFIETTAIPETTFRVTEPGSNNIVHYGDLNLVYGPGSGSISSQLSLPSNKIYVPSGRNFQVEVQSHASSNGKIIQTTLTIDEFIDTALDAGERADIDLRSLALPQGVSKLQSETEAIESIINEKEEQGFFLAVERQQLTKIKQTTNAAISLIDQSRYNEAFTKSREIFILISDLETGLNNMLVDAVRSVYILVGFIGLTSIIVASLLFEDSLRKIIVSVGFFSVLLYSLYILHPGTQFIKSTELMQISLISLVSLNIIAFILPRFLSRPSTGVEVSLLNMIIPIFSISKRSLRRRRVRFALTLSSILLLVASFISLTSFTSGYGLSFTKSTGTVMKEGVMIRTPDPPPDRASAPFSGGQGVAGPLPLDESLLQWYGQMEEVEDAVPRYENNPQRQYRESNTPIGRIGRTPIFGVVAIEPELEAKVNNLDSAVVEGRYLGDRVGETLISVDLANEIDAIIGDTLTVSVKDNIHELTIVGLLDDKTLEDLTDIDGKSILPNKIIEWERIEADGPDFVIEALAPCDPEEVIWINIKTGENMSALNLLRINILLQDGVDIIEFARSTALNRGFRAWASTLSGVYLAQLTGYFEGKGLPIVIPWVIVVLNVVVTMMNAYYERSHEVMIYSSIGMNPRHVSSIFLAEAAVIGVLGGCLGYLFGLGAYKIIYVLTPALQVKQKVSAVWSLAAIGISMMAVIVGGISALRNSTSITPSLRRRWTIDKKQVSMNETKMKIPIQVYEEEIDEYIDFISEKLEQAKKNHTMAVRIPKMTQTGEKSWVYSFIYCSANAQISPLYSRNRLIVEKGQEKTYTTTLYSQGDADSVKQAGSFLRQIGLDWSLQREEGEHRMGTSLNSIEGFDVL